VQGEKCTPIAPYKYKLIYHGNVKYCDMLKPNFEFILCIRPMKSDLELVKF